MHLIQDSICVYSLMPTQPLVKLYDLKNGKNMGELKIGSKNRVNSYLSDGDGVMAANDSVIVSLIIIKSRSIFMMSVL